MKPKEVKCLNLDEKLGGLKKRLNKKSFGGKIGFKGSKPMKASAGQGIKTLRGMY